MHYSSLQSKLYNQPNCILVFLNVFMSAFAHISVLQLNIKWGGGQLFAEDAEFFSL